jgi:hypothetical protein
MMMNDCMSVVAGGAMSSGDGGGSLSCLLMRGVVLGRVFGFNHKIMINF